MPAMKFVQFADVHLDSSIGGALNLTDENKSILRQDIRTAINRARDLVIETKADIVLIPGDLFDYESMCAGTPSFLIDLFESMGPTWVFITPGNHDSLRPGNPFRLKQGTIWPENVHIFTFPEFETIIIPELDCAVTGIAHAHRGITDRLLSRTIERSNCAINILLFHGSRDGYKPSGKESVIPFSDDELLAQAFTYTAIGHYHSFGSITDNNGRIRAAYSGCLQGRGLDETGEKYVLVGEIGSDGNVVLKKKEVAPRRVMSVEVDVTGATEDAIVMSRIDAALASVNARECDLININLSGYASALLNLDLSELESAGRYFHVNINRSRVEPDYDLESMQHESAASSLKVEFVRRMLELQKQSADPAEQQILRDAIYYGLYALDGRKLEPRDAN